MYLHIFDYAIFSNSGGQSFLKCTRHEIFPSTYYSPSKTTPVEGLVAGEGVDASCTSVRYSTRGVCKSPTCFPRMFSLTHVLIFPTHTCPQVHVSHSFDGLISTFPQLNMSIYLHAYMFSGQHPLIRFIASYPHFLACTCTHTHVFSCLHFLTPTWHHTFISISLRSLLAREIVYLVCL